MSTVAVVAWSGTGNTEAMARGVAEGLGVDKVLSCGDVSSVADYDGLALGCPSMGAEVLEEGEFQPFWDSIKDGLKGKKVVLFGSYGWGDGEWMRSWESECDDLGITVVGTYICNDCPGADELEECKSLGKSLME